MAPGADDAGTTAPTIVIPTMAHYEQEQQLIMAARERSQQWTAMTTSEDAQGDLEARLPKRKAVGIEAALFEGFRVVDHEGPDTEEENQTCLKAHERCNTGCWALLYLLGLV